MKQALKIFHCADLHVGLKFAKYPAAVSEKLREARLATLERMVERANKEACDLFVVAGDLFDTLKVPARDVARAAKILSRFDRVAAVLPGNHDFFSGPGDDFWKNFERPDHGRLLLLDTPRAYPLNEFGIDAVLYACPCGSKYSAQHAVGWAETAERPPAQFHVGIAHGSFEGLSPDLQGNYFPMKADDLLRAGLDLWLLGHIHVQYPPRAPGPGDRIFYSGTHEPDGLDCRHEGRAWLIEIQDDSSIRAQSLSTGAFRFRDEEISVRALSELESFAARFSAEESARTILRLSVKGVLQREEHERFPALIEQLQERFLHLESDFSGLGLELTPSEIDRQFARESFPHRLLSELSRSEHDREALQAA
ncbi:MAG: metallophosphoesterase family protein, partial [Bdellovibrionota bacterium]